MFSIIILVFISFLLINTYYIKINTYFISNSRIKSSYRIAHISDIHGRVRYLNGSLSHIINKHDVDYLIITGDLCNNLSQIKFIRDEICKMQVSKKIFIVLGNYEREEIYFFRKRKVNTIDKLLQFNKMGNIKILINQYEFSDYHNDILFYGFDNSVYGNEFYSFDSKDCADIYKIFFAHSPNIINYLKTKGIDFDMLLTGHTHGNQINIPFLSKFVGKYRNFHIGVKEEEGKYFAISRGLGTSKLPFRFNCYPEISIFGLTPEQRK